MKQISIFYITIIIFLIIYPPSLRADNLLIHDISINIEKPVPENLARETEKDVIQYLQGHYSQWIKYDLHKPPDYLIYIDIKQNEDWLVINTRLDSRDNHMTSKKTRTTHPIMKDHLLPRVIAGDIFYSWAEVSSAVFIYERPPELVSVLDLETLNEVTDFPGTGAGSENDAIPALSNIAKSGKDLLITLSSGYLHLDPFLRITQRTMRDKLIQKKYNMQNTVKVAVSNILGDLKIFYFNDKFTLIDSGIFIRVFEQEYRDSFARAGNTAAGQMLSLDNGQLNIYRRINNVLQKTAIQTGPGFVTAFNTDERIWIFDVLERRIRVMDSRGEIIDSIKPVLLPQEMQFPELLEPISDQGFLIGGGGKLWKFNNQGIPACKLESIRLAGNEAFPGQFQAIVLDNPPSVIITDPLHNRLLQFREADPLQDNNISFLLKQLNKPDNEILVQLIRHYKENDQLLLAVQYCTQLADRQIDIAEQELINQIYRLFKKKMAAGLAAFSRTLERDLLLGEAEAFYQSSLDTYRLLRNEYPVDQDFPGIITELNNTRKEIRKIIRTEPDFSLGIKSLQEDGSLDYRNNGSNSLTVILSNFQQIEFTDLKINLALNGFFIEPAELFRDLIPAGGGIVIPCTFRLEKTGSQLFEETCQPLSLLINYYENGMEKQNYLKHPVTISPVR